MFGLGLGECLLILALFVLVFGPRFLVNSCKRIFNSFAGFKDSFTEARADAPSPLGPTTVKVIKPTKEQGEEASP